MNRIAPVLLSVAVACGGGAKRPVPAEPMDLAAPPAARPDPAAATKVAPPAPPIAVGHPKDDLIPRSVLFGNPDRVGVQISPDGKQLAWLAPKDGVMNVWVAPVDQLAAAKPVTSEAARPIRGYVWANTSKHLLYFQDQGGDENFHIFRVDLADAKTTDLTPYPKARAELLGRDDAAPTTVAITVNDRDPKVFDLYTLDILTGKRTLVALNDNAYGGFVIDTHLRPRMAPKSLPDGSTEWYVTDAKPAKDGKRTWKLFDTIPFEDAATTSYFGLTPDGKGAYATDSRLGDTGAVVAVDFATKRATKLASDPKAEAGATWIDPHTGKLQGVAYAYLKPAWTVVDKAIAPDVAALAKLTTGSFTVSSRSLDQRKWIVATSTEQKPADYYLYDHANHKATFLFTALPAWAKYRAAAMTPVEVPTRDGLTMVGYLTLPVALEPGKRPATPLPMVLLVHGGPWARDDWGYDPLHQLFADRGYAVLSVNFRGSTGFGKTFVNAGNLEWGKKMEDDLLDAMAWAEQQGYAKPKSTAIVGGSYGGYATLAGLAMHPDAFACGIDLVGPSNLETLLATIPPYWAPALAMFHKRMGDPTTPEGKTLLAEASPLTHAAAIAKPLLIGQGANDPRVNHAESEQIVAAMQQHGLPVTYAVFPDEGHGFARPENNIAFFAAAEAFLSAHLGGNYLPMTSAELHQSSMKIEVGTTGIPGLPK